MKRGRPGGASLPPGVETPRPALLNRRRLLAGVVGGGLLSALPTACRGWGEGALLEPPVQWPAGFVAPPSQTQTLPPELAPGITPRRTAALHNNFYEFLPGRGGAVWKHTRRFQVEPWTVDVVGECRRPRTFDLDALLSFPHEERLYHFRCVERWAMNVPWIGFPLRLLLERVEPTSRARYVAFTSAHRPGEMPGVDRAPHLPWPYHEGLRLDEAFCDLTFVATGVYQEPLLKQHGAPVRVVVPWKYGYKSPKSVVRIELTRDQPPTFWQAVPHEYGFLSNVNPNIPHPRWRQDLSFWLHDDDLGATADRAFPTPLFNGYEAQVAALYPDEPRTPQPILRPGEVAR